MGKSQLADWGVRSSSFKVKQPKKGRGRIRRDENLVYDQSAEQGVLAILLNSEAAVNRLKDLKASLFADKRNKAILKSLIKLHRKGMPISEKSLSDYLLRSKERVEEIGGPHYLIEVSKNYFSDLNFD